MWLSVQVWEKGMWKIIVEQNGFFSSNRFPSARSIVCVGVFLSIVIEQAIKLYSTEHHFSDSIFPLRILTKSYSHCERTVHNLHFSNIQIYRLNTWISLIRALQNSEQKESDSKRLCGHFTFEPFEPFSTEMSWILMIHWLIPKIKLKVALAVNRYFHFSFLLCATRGGLFCPCAIGKALILHHLIIKWLADDYSDLT